MDAPVRSACRRSRPAPLVGPRPGFTNHGDRRYFCTWRARMRMQAGLNPGSCRSRGCGRLLQQWVAFWGDLIEFEIVPVVPSADTRTSLDPLL